MSDQERANEAAAVEMGAEIGDRRYSDLVSASRFGKKPRGDWPKLVGDVSNGQLDIIFMWACDRGDRTLESWAGFLERCREQSVQLYSIRDRRAYDPRNPRDWKTLAESGVDAQYESEVRSVDVLRGVAGAAMAGKPHGHSAHGFTRQYDPKDRKIFTEVPNEDAPAVIEIITRIAKREPITVIRKNLNERGIFSPGGGPWTNGGVRRIATNVAYVGLREHTTGQGDGKQTFTYPANWESISDAPDWEEVFWTAQRILGEPDRRKSPPGATKYLLSYLMHAECGFQMNVNGGTKKQVPPRYRCVEDGCTSIDMATADEYVFRLIEARMKKPDARTVFRPRTLDAGRARAKLLKVQGELDDLEEQLKKGPHNGGISAALAAAAEPDIRRRLAEAETEVKRFAGEGALAPLLDAPDIRAAWLDMPLAARREAVKALFSKITVWPVPCVLKPYRLTRWANEEDRLFQAAKRITVEWA